VESCGELWRAELKVESYGELSSKWRAMES
jgi:hypothetical protein